MARKVAFRKKRQNKLGLACVTIVVAVFVVVMLFGIRNLQKKQASYIEREEALQAQIDAEDQRAQDLVDYEKYTKTAKFVEEVAKEKLGLVYEDEILFKSDIKK